MGTIAEKLTAVANSKAAIASAITGKGGTVPTKFSDYGTAVSALPNTYTAGDEGKVVSNGALVSQTSLSVTDNGTYDTTTKNSVTVSVSGGGDSKFAALVSGSITEVTAQDLNGVTSLRSYAFGYLSSEFTIVFPNTITSLGSYAFYNSLVKSVTLSNTLTTISNYAFYGCNRLTSIVIPDSVTTISTRSFYNCSQLATIDFGTTRNTVPTLNNADAFTNLPANYQIWVPGELLATWKNTENWINLASHICPYQAIEGGECVSEGNGASAVSAISGTFDANAAFNIDSEGQTMFSENSTLWIGDSIDAIDDSGFEDDFGGPMYNDGQNEGCWGYLKFCNIPQEEVETWSGYPWGFPTNRISYLSRPE